MTGQRTYLDHNATSPLRPGAREAMLAAMSCGGNASSVHLEGRAARKIIDEAREKVALLAGCRPDMVVFTSGGTEANNLAIRGTEAERLIVCASEHKAVLDPASADGRSIKVVGVDGDGRIDLKALEDELKRDASPALVSVMLANNETGTVQPVSEIANLVHGHGGLLHTDAVQAAGKVNCAWPMIGADLMTLSAHKLGGPQGAGALIVADGVAIDPQVRGGGQELGRRCGTESLTTIAGFGAACEAAHRDRLSFVDRMKKLRDALEARVLEALPGTVIFSRSVDRLANTSCLATPGVTAELALMALDMDGIAISSGSACSSGKVASSHVLEAMGVSPDLAACAIRISFGWNSTMEDVDRFVTAWSVLAQRAEANAA